MSSKPTNRADEYLPKFLKLAGLPTDPSDIISVDFKFLYINKEKQDGVVYGTVAGVNFCPKGEEAPQISLVLQGVDSPELVTVSYQSDGSWLMLPFGRLGKFVLLQL